MKTMMKRWVSVGVGLLLGAFAATGASASPEFPGLLVSQLGLKAEPDCTVCHIDSEGGAGTVTKPFGRALQGRGLKSGNGSSLSQAIARLRTDRIDSDGDGTPDVDELVLGRDPNVRDGTPPSDVDASVSGDGGTTLSPPGVTPSDPLPPPPRYGCGAQMAPGPVDVGWFAIPLALGTVFARSRSKARRGR